MAKRISVINFKGGVGKTTFAFNLAAGLARFYDATRVLIVDVDHQSSLSILALGGSQWDNAVKSGSTATEIFKTFTVSQTNIPDENIIVRNPLAGTQYNNLDVVPASLELDDVEIELTSTHQGNAIQSEWNKRTLICKWIEDTGIDNKYDYIIFDCPPATKVVAQNAIAASHGYLVPVVPEAVMERGAPHLVNMVKSKIDTKLDTLSQFGDKRKKFIKRTKLAGMVITRIQVSGIANSGYVDDHTIYLNSLRAQFGKDLLKPYIVSGTGVSQALSEGRPVYDFPRSQNIGRRKINKMYKELTDVVKARIDALP